MREVWCLVDSQGCEALYVDKELVEEGSPLNEGTERVLYFIDLAKKYEINIEDIKFWYVPTAIKVGFEEFPEELYDEYEEYIEKIK